MRTIAKLAPLSTAGGRSTLLTALDTVRRALGAAADRRPARPMRDIDDWSDQAEVAYYESCPAARLP